MSEYTTDLEQVLSLALKLSPLDKAHLVERVAATLRSDLKAHKQPKRSLYGIFADVHVSDEDIDEARREMWGNFPREDI